jgi:hypothetical protein
MFTKNIGSINKSTYKNRLKWHFLEYSIGIIHNLSNKNCVQIGSSVGVCHDQINKVLNSSDELLPEVKGTINILIKDLAKDEKGWLIFDDTLMKKPFAKAIEGVNYHYDTQSRSLKKSLSIVACVWDNSKVTIPIDAELYDKQKTSGSKKHTKLDLVKLIVERIYDKTTCKGLLLDALYASRDMIKFFTRKKIKFVMRIPSNRLIQVPGSEKAVKLRDVPGLKLRKNERSRTMCASWHGIPLFFTVEKRIKKNGEKVLVYLVSNWEAPSKEVVQTYKRRWAIEKFFRTAKQSLGLQDCSARSINKQRMHIGMVFYSYAFLQWEGLKKKVPNSESAIKDFRSLKFDECISRIQVFSRNFEALA